MAKIKRYINPEEKKAKKTLGETFLPSQIDTGILRKIKYEYPQNPIWIEHSSEEFTCLCPFSGLPDYAKITVRYIPHKYCVELRSFKYYLLSFRQVKIFHEHAVNKILQDLTALLHPREMRVEMEFNIRGGIKTKVTAEFSQEKPRYDSE